MFILNSKEATAFEVVPYFENDINIVVNYKLTKFTNYS